MPAAQKRDMAHIPSKRFACSSRHSRLFSGILPPQARNCAPGNEREILMMPARINAGNDVPSIFCLKPETLFPER